MKPDARETSVAPDSQTPIDAASPLRRTRIANFFNLASYQITMRIGWIFKTESIVMPAVMDLLCGPSTALAAWLRSWLPQLNRIGQSLPQLFFAERIRNLPRKKFLVAICSGFMGLVFLGFATLWHFSGGEPSHWVRVVFLLLYALFFLSVGLNNLGFNTLQGKLVLYDFRGRLLLFANLFGGMAAITAAAFLLSRWLQQTSGDFTWIFAFAGTCFCLGSLLTLLLNEDKEGEAHSQRPREKRLALFFQTLSTDRDFRMLASIAACFGCSMMLFPHYQALYRESVGSAAEAYSLKKLVSWVILQNTGTILFSILAGTLADRLGNRVALRCVMLLLFTTPCLAILLATFPSYAPDYFWWVFVILGVTPVIFRVLNNFALELAPRQKHPQYLAYLSVCIAMPVIIFSQIAGWLIPIAGFRTVFAIVAGLILAGWIGTLWIAEPRNRLTSESDDDDNKDTADPNPVADE